MNRFKEYPTSLKRSAMSLIMLSPMIVAIIALVGLTRAFMTKEFITSVFGHGAIADTLIGTVTGMIAVGQAIVSYIIGGELLQDGVSLYAVSAFILAWVSLGVVQLPLEAEVLGVRFTILRNIFAFVFTIIVAVLTVLSVKAIS